MRRVAIVTGANSGVGLETARGLAQRGFHVVLAVRDLAKGEVAARDIDGHPSPPQQVACEPMRLDLADLGSVRAFANAFLARHERLDVLVNNAGIHTAQRALSAQGHELTFATNHLGHFLLTHLLLDILKRSAPARIVNVASEAHWFARRVEPGGPAGGGLWDGVTAYNQSKLANVMFTYALARRLEGTGVSAFAVHPGAVRTGWGRGRDSGVFRFATKLATPFLVSPERGARTSVHAATSPELEGRSGLYLVRSRPSRSSGPSRDVEAQERLWRASEELVGLR
ncbi:MAG TPA: SDR family oxidoreductase [Candidatus Thermoplasmatota archaeon]|nr:SDR family oxidoreductase [Candidatus Thermoplasmatota archaeon]